uniref:MHC class I-like antigen recognition-like domain-containing protein n=1 Tax=Ornithorhynchus anatinus TaxID=9258 RepID=F6RN88_ORNAN
MEPLAFPMILLFLYLGSNPNSALFCQVTWDNAQALCLEGHEYGAPGLSYDPTVPVPGGCTLPDSLHFFHYYFRVVSQPDPELPVFMAVGYVDDQWFMRFGSLGQSAEAPSAWIREGRGLGYWKQQTQNLQDTVQIFLGNLQISLSYYSQIEGGSQSYQETYGCQLQANGSPGGLHHPGLWHAYLSGGLPGAQNTKWKWKANRNFTKSTWRGSECIGSRHTCS